MNFKDIYAYLTSPTVMFLALPMGLAFAIAALPAVLIPLEYSYFEQLQAIPLVGSISAVTARSLVATIAGGAITALSLIYSLVLVVFSLAAANIGPRLLKRFYSERVNQITAGLFGGTFLLSIELLFFIGNNFVPRIGLLLLAALCVVMVFQLIYFVRHVSRSITIDDQVADIAKDILSLIHQQEERGKEASGKEQIEIDVEPEAEIKAHTSGYLNWIPTEMITSFASKHDVLIWLEKETGDFVTEGELLLKSSRSLDEEEVEELTSLLLIEQSREARHSLNFHVDLLIELALRALSPGVNDTFTALSICDSFAVILSTSTFASNFKQVKDTEGEVRLLERCSGTATLIRRVFDPLRQASPANMLMIRGIGKALSLIFLTGDEEQAEEAKRQMKLLLKAAAGEKHLEEDIDALKASLPGALLG